MEAALPASEHMTAADIEHSIRSYQVSPGLKWNKVPRVQQ